VSADALLARNPQPTRAEVEEGLAGNLCRCAGYEQIIEAVLAAAAGSVAAPVPDTVSIARRPDPAATPDASVAPQ
jgi:xanthine dehydrogenase iron-sulfur cluster and FAD-binding subunit A